MTQATIRAAIATMQRGVSGVLKAYDQLPRGPLVEADLPAFLTFVRDAQHDHEIIGDDATRTSRQYLMQLYVLPVALAVPGEAEALVEPFIDAVLSYFDARPSLNRTASVMDAYIESDTGPRQLVWADVAYWGVEFRLRVYEYRRRTYAANE